MVVVFSFSLYGSGRKFTLGMMKNVECIAQRFPDAKVWIYCADDVPRHVVYSLEEKPNVKIINVSRKPHSGNMKDRFLAVDEEDADIVFVRDADSRVYDRDASCIEDFINSNKMFHVIRDHSWGHWHKIMGGMWGMRKGALGSLTMEDLIEEWMLKTEKFGYEADQEFLEREIYPRCCKNMMVHDEVNKIEPDSMKVPFRVPMMNDDFVGQAYDFDDAGNEVRGYKY